MIELLFWVTVTSLLTPVALGLARDLISGIREVIDRARSWDSEGDEFRFDARQGSWSGGPWALPR